MFLFIHILQTIISTVLTCILADPTASNQLTDKHQTLCIITLALFKLVVIITHHFPSTTTKSVDSCWHHSSQLASHHHTSLLLTWSLLAVGFSNLCKQFKTKTSKLVLKSFVFASPSWPPFIRYHDNSLSNTGDAASRRWIDNLFLKFIFTF